MRSLVNGWVVGTLILAGTAACAHEERVPTQHPVSTPTVDVVDSRPRAGATNQQPPSTPEAPFPSVTENVEPPAPSINVVPPATGVTEPQGDDRTRALQVLSLASAQLDRLRRMETTASDTLREDIEAALANLQGRRQRVLEDMKELELAPAGSTADLQVLLNRDVAALQNALRRTYAIAPALSEGLPQPSPLAPSAIP
jgi:hypothetical protein